MGQTITIEPVTRIEGHAKVNVHLDDSGRVEKARFHVNEFRGFEKFCEGRMFYEMPQITERICGICPVSHHLASIHACDAIVGADPPRTAKLLRELMHMGQIIQSHSMHFFELAAPDLLLGFDASPDIRNVAGLAARDPQLALKAIRLRKFGQEIIARLGERRIHPTFAVPGGVNRALSAGDRDAILSEIDEMIRFVQDGLAVFKGWMQQHQAEMASFASFPTCYLGMVRDDGAADLYAGKLRLVDAELNEIAHFDGGAYLDNIAEHVEPWSYLKFPYYKPQGWPRGVYRVGPLARLNVATKLATPLAQVEFELFRQICGGKVVQGSLYYHYARLIEDLAAVERARDILLDREILSTDIRTGGEKVVDNQGVGVLEAPRGTLWHHYWVDENGKIEKVNLIVATGNNNYAMSRAVEEVAKAYVAPPVTEGALNRIEAAIRAYDPCLSCSTHARGQMPIEVNLFDSDGNALARTQRGGGG